MNALLYKKKLYQSQVEGERLKARSRRPGSKGQISVHRQKARAGPGPKAPSSAELFSRLDDQIMTVIDRQKAFGANLLGSD